MSDNAKCYSTSHAFRDTLAELGARHILIPPYTPRWNGKIERFFGTLDAEWAHGRVWPNSSHPRPRPVIVHPLLQPPATTLSRRRPSHPSRVSRSAGGQLGRRRSAAQARARSPRGTRRSRTRPPAARRRGRARRSRTATARSCRPNARSCGRRPLRRVVVDVDLVVDERRSGRRRRSAAAPPRRRPARTRAICTAPASRTAARPVFLPTHVGEVDVVQSARRDARVDLRRRRRRPRRASACGSAAPRRRPPAPASACARRRRPRPPSSSSPERVTVSSSHLPGPGRSTSAW